MCHSKGKLMYEASQIPGHSDIVAYIHSKNSIMDIFQYFFEYIETPVFVLNPLYDSYQVYMIKGLFCLPPNCNEEQYEKFIANKDVSEMPTLKVLYVTLHIGIHVN